MIRLNKGFIIEELEVNIAEETNKGPIIEKDLELKMVETIKEEIEEKLFKDINEIKSYDFNFETYEDDLNNISLNVLHIQRLKLLEVLELDSSRVNDLCEPPTAIGNIIDSIRQKLQDFRRTKVSHICRQGNRPVHILARRLVLGQGNVGVPDVIFESDSKIVCDAVTGTESPSTINTLIEGIRLQLQDFQRARVSHVLRQGNRFAHLLAQYARHVVGYVTWIKETLYMVESTMTHDIMLLS
ncbi:hypothetical protein SO802_006405 [Lithocarpus litseifolius]|uniref:RNase H type-1 domain-containing protein n=1 Tax=Lithocarpus litseifolius TaxID=425828 RepID=A0AAW2DNC0_9ROSI